LNITPHETWDIYDASKVQEYAACPRSYFFRYILGWDLETENHHLIFGQAWHKAMEVLTSKGAKPENIEEAFAAFGSIYNAKVDPDNIKGNKDMEHALMGIATYVEHYNSESFECLSVETHGTVPIGGGRLAQFRLDAVCKDHLGIYILEHKTGSADSTAWRNQWALSMQVGLYLHVLYYITDDYKEVWGAKVNGAIFRSKDVGLIRIPVRKTPGQLQNWLDTFNFFVTNIERDIERLLSFQDGDMGSIFHMNPTSCCHYGTCKFHDLCTSWDNPLEHCEKPPMGFEVRWWNPKDVEKENAKKIINIEDTYGK